MKIFVIFLLMVTISIYSGSATNIVGEEPLLTEDQVVKYIQDDLLKDFKKKFARNKLCLPNCNIIELVTVRNMAKETYLLNVDSVTDSIEITFKILEVGINTDDLLKKWDQNTKDKLAKVLIKLTKIDTYDMTTLIWAVSMIEDTRNVEAAAVDKWIATLEFYVLAHDTAKVLQEDQQEMTTEFIHALLLSIQQVNPDFLNEQLEDIMKLFHPTSGCKLEQSVINIIKSELDNLLQKIVNGERNLDSLWEIIYLSVDAVTSSENCKDLSNLKSAIKAKEEISTEDILAKAFDNIFGSSTMGSSSKKSFSSSQQAFAWG